MSLREDAARHALELAERSATGSLGLLEQARARLERIQREPKEPPRDSVVRFKVRYSYDRGDTSYTYIATRVAAGWYVTGQRGVMKWDDVLALASHDVYVKDGTRPLRIRSLVAGEWIK